MAVTLAAASVAGCQRRSSLVPGPDGGAAGGGGTADAGPVPDGGATGGAGEGGVARTFDPGTVGIRRLSDVEYARSVRDLLGLTSIGGDLVASFPDHDFQGGGLDLFDDLGGGTVISPDRFEAYFRNAVVLVRQAFASDAVRARIVTCAPASAADDACARDIVRAFGLRAWRRPLSDGEIADLVALVRADLTAGDDVSGALQQAVVSVLVSESFLYRIEHDPPPPDVTVHPLTSYELATRLSYLVWSSTPDDALLALAASDALQKAEVLTAQVTRMLADPRADGLVSNFFGQWLNFRVLDGPLLDRGTGPWSAALQASAAAEARLFVTEIVQGDASVGELLTADVNYADSLLASLYGFPAPAIPDAQPRTVVTTDERKGYLGLAAFLAVESARPEASRFPRGMAIDRQLLCLEVPPPPPTVPPVPPPGTPRDQYRALEGSPTCGACHKMFEPLGLGLESFDAIGQFRATYPGNPAPIDASGALPDGTPFNGLAELAALLGKDQRVVDCARREALVYTLGRPLTDADADRLAAIDARWSAAGHTIRGLLVAIVVDDLFRNRRGEGTP